MAQSHSVEVLDHFQISPPPGSIPTTKALPLTFFDLPWLLCRPMQRLLFYDLPHSTVYFMHSILPALKTSLSLTLRHFSPLAGNLLCPPPPHKPHIVFNECDWVSMTVAKSTVDFNQVIGDRVRDVRELHPFVPGLPPALVTPDGTRVVPLLTVQITLFPNSGLCIGVQFRHVVADGMAFNHFMKFWASVLRSSREQQPLPSYDRAMVKDPNGLQSIFLKEWFNWASSWDHNMGSTPDDQLADKVRSTFVIEREHIDRLKSRVSVQGLDSNPGRLHVSTFVVTCALTWVSLIQSQEENGVGDLVDDDKLYYLSFVADCRQRLEIKLPATYFGNCLAICYVPVKRSELMRENGIVAAAKAIGNKIKELEGGVLRGAEKWLSNWRELSEEGRLITVAGSPKLRVYETDFGWGRPRKSELVQIDVSGAIYLSECRDRESGVEVGLALPRSRMDVFNAIFDQCLKHI